MSESRIGPLELEAAYEHAVSFSERPGSLGGSLLLEAAVPAGADWLDLSWTVTESGALLWTHRFDRLNAAWSPTSYLRVRAGRQTISWASTLLLTPPIHSFLSIRRTRFASSELASTRSGSRPSRAR